MQFLITLEKSGINCNRIHRGLKGPFCPVNDLFRPLGHSLLIWIFMLKEQSTPGRIFCHWTVIVFVVDNSQTFWDFQPVARKIMKSVFLTRVWLNSWLTTMTIMLLVSLWGGEICVGRALFSTHWPDHELPCLLIIRERGRVGACS